MPHRSSIGGKASHYRSPVRRCASITCQSGRNGYKQRSAAFLRFFRFKNFGMPGWNTVSTLSPPCCDAASISKSSMAASMLRYSTPARSCSCTYKRKSAAWPGW